MIVISVLLAIFAAMTIAAILHEVTKPTCFSLFAEDRELCQTCANKQACYIKSREK